MFALYSFEEPWHKVPGGFQHSTKSKNELDTLEFMTLPAPNNHHSLFIQFRPDDLVMDMFSREFTMKQKLNCSNTYNFFFFKLMISSNLKIQDPGAGEMA